MIKVYSIMMNGRDKYTPQEVMKTLLHLIDLDNYELVNPEETLMYQVYDMFHYPNKKMDIVCKVKEKSSQPTELPVHLL